MSPNPLSFRPHSVPTKYLGSQRWSARFLIFLTLTLLAPGYGQTESATLQNSGFEDGAGDDRVPLAWTGAVGQPHAYAIVSIDALNATDGDIALLASSDPSAGAITQLTALNLEPGVTYSLSADFAGRVSRDTEPGGYWLRLLARSRANPTVAFILQNVVGGADEITAGEWQRKELRWTAPATLTQVPVISNGIVGGEPDATADLSREVFGLEILIGGNFPDRFADPYLPLQQTWIDQVKFTRDSTANAASAQ